MWRDTEGRHSDSRMHEVPYGVYRRIWHALPVSYETFFPYRFDGIFQFHRASWLRGKVITTVHDLTFIRYPETMEKKKLHRIRNDIVYSLQRSDRILTVSEFTKKELCQVYFTYRKKKFRWCMMRRPCHGIQQTLNRYLIDIESANHIFYMPERLNRGIIWCGWCMHLKS